MSVTVSLMSAFIIILIIKRLEGKKFNERWQKNEAVKRDIRESSKNVN